MYINIFIIINIKGDMKIYKSLKKKKKRINHQHYYQHYYLYLPY